MWPGPCLQQCHKTVQKFELRKHQELIQHSKSQAEAAKLGKLKRAGLERAEIYTTWVATKD